MDKFSKSILEQILYNFPELIYDHNKESAFLELEIPTQNISSIGGLIIQTTTEKDIWIRNNHPFSAYLVDTTEELITIIKGVLTNKILRVIACMDGEWVETTLIKEGSDVHKENGMTYTILCWSGTSDRSFKME